MDQYANPPIQLETTVKGLRMFTQLTDCGHAGLLHIEIGTYVKPKLINAKPGESVTRSLFAFSEAEVAALFAVQPVLFSLPATMHNLANHFFINHSERHAPLFSDEPGFVQWLAERPLTECFSSHQEAAERLARYEPNPNYTAVMHHWHQFLEQLPEQQVFALASA